MNSRTGLPAVIDPPIACARESIRVVHAEENSGVLFA